MVRASDTRYRLMICKLFEIRVRGIPRMNCRSVRSAAHGSCSFARAGQDSIREVGAEVSTSLHFNVRHKRNSDDTEWGSKLFGPRHWRCKTSDEIDTCNAGLIEETSRSLETDGDSVLHYPVPDNVCTRDATEDCSCVAACLVAGIKQKKLES
jgi:hypothetical protein